MESLSPLQKSFVVHVVEHQKNAFLTGSAGTGKSCVLRFILRALFLRHGKRCVVTASTGIAANLLGGITLHRFAGIGLGKDSVQKAFMAIGRNSGAKRRWTETNVLVIDEISMISREYFEKLDALGRLLRHNERPFGGIQLVVAGDFLQLPPVGTFDFLYESDSFKAIMNEGTFVLEHVFRQSDPTFAALLRALRRGELSEETLRVLKSLETTVFPNDGIEVTRLFSHREKVDGLNQKALAQLETPSVVFTAQDTMGGEYGGVPPYPLSPVGHLPMAQGVIGERRSPTRVLGERRSPFRFPTSLELKQGAQVVFLKNDASLGLFCGARGVVTHVDERAQGVSVNFACHPKTLFIKRAREDIEDPRYPGRVIASRFQVPLLLSWALTIHRAQGLTLDRVEVDLGSCFECGMAYVALSRAKTVEGLRIRNFNKRSLMAHPKIVEFYKKLS